MDAWHLHLRFEVLAPFLLACALVHSFFTIDGFVIHDMNADSGEQSTPLVKALQDIEKRKNAAKDAINDSSSKKKKQQLSVPGDSDDEDEDDDDSGGISSGCK